MSQSSNNGKSSAVARPLDPLGYPSGGYDNGNLKEYTEQALDILQRRKWIILATCVIIVSFFGYQVYRTAPSYSASSLVMITEDRTPGGLVAQQHSEHTEPFARSERSAENELIILRSSWSLPRAVAERLIEKQVVPMSNRPILLLLGPDSTELSVEQVTMRVRRSVSFRPASQDGKVIEIVASSSDPVEAALIANLYVDAYLQLTQQASRSRLTSTRLFLEEQADRHSEDLETLEREIEAFQTEHGAITLDREGTALANRMAQTQAERDEAQLALRTHQASLESLESRLASINPEGLSRRVGSGAEREIEGLQSRIAELELSKRDIQLQGRALTASDSAQITQIDSRIGQLRTDVDRLSRTYVDEVMASGGLGAADGVRHVEELQLQIAERRIEVSGLETRIAVLSQRLRQYDAELRTIPQQSMRLAQLQRDRRYAEQMYEYVIQQLQETQFREESQFGYANRVTEASIPGFPSSPAPWQEIFKGLLLGLLLGTFLALLRDRLDRRIYNPDAIEKRGYALAGIIPNLKPLIDDHFRGRSTVKYGEHAFASTLVTLTDSLSGAAEAYRRLRTFVMFSRRNSHFKSLLVTSAGMGDGKSLTAANLAIVMAQSGRRTLLIDADLHRACLHELFGVEQQPGLSNVLKAGLDKPLHIQTTCIEHLHLLPAGLMVGDATELLGSEQLRSLVTILKEHFDFIIIDAPPVLATSDSTLFSTQTDATLVVVRAGQTTEAELDHTMNDLNDVGANVVGVLLNGFDVSMAYGYKLRYRHYSRYGPYSGYKRYGQTAVTS